MDVVAAVCVPPVHEGMIHTPTITAMFGAIMHYSAETDRNVFQMIQGHAYIPAGRTLVCDFFLDKTDAEWLWFIDWDMVFPTDSLSKLLAVADPVERPVVGAIYFNVLSDKQIHPVWLEKQRGTGLFKPVDEVEVDELRQVESTGMGCTVIHRSVLEGLRKEYAPDPWYAFGHDLIGIDGYYQRAGEDTTFCMRANKAGYKVWGYAGVRCDHIKTHRITWGNATQQVTLGAPLTEVPS